MWLKIGPLLFLGCLLLIYFVIPGLNLIFVIKYFIDYGGIEHYNDDEYYMPYMVLFTTIFLIRFVRLFTTIRLTIYKDYTIYTELK